MEITFLILLLIITTTSTKFYNSRKLIVNENYKEIINNIYFQKSINHIFDNFSPRYKVIEHKVLQGEGFDKILERTFVPEGDLSLFQQYF